MTYITYHIQSRRLGKYHDFINGLRVALDSEKTIQIPCSGACMQKIINTFKNEFDIELNVSETFIIKLEHLLDGSWITKRKHTGYTIKKK